MGLNDFVDSFRNQFDETAPELINENTNFKELDEWSSLVAMGVIAMVDEDYAVTIKGEDIRTASTVKDLYEIVKARV